MESVIKEQLLLAIEGTADWRERVVAENHPEDDRNVQAARDLYELAESVRSLPDADWRFAKIEAFYNGDDAPGVTLSEEEGEMLRDVGFRLGYSSGGEFLDALVARFQEITQAPLPI